MKLPTGLVAVVVLAATACTTAGGGGTVAAQPPPNGEVWCLGDSRGSGLSGSYIGWGSLLPCKNFAVWGSGFTIASSHGPAVPVMFETEVGQRGLPAKVYVSAGYNDAAFAHDAGDAASAFHDHLTALGVEQVWATSPYSATDVATNVRLEQLNASETWAKECAGADPNPNTIDAIHLTTAATQTFADCIS
jgi:hypothetical protein